MSDRSDDLVRVLAIADTHLRGDKAARLLGRLGPLLDDVDVILHAGDITDVSVIEALAAIAEITLQSIADASAGRPLKFRIGAEYEAEKHG